MDKEQQLGLEELMIVNPSPAGGDALFLDADGALYQVQSLGNTEGTPGMGQFFLGEDGILYQVQAAGLEPGLGENDAPELGHYFLGENGVLYEVVR